MALRGNCYVAAEALYHILGGKEAGWTPMVARTDTDTHWWIQKGGFRLDPSRRQFNRRGKYWLENNVYPKGRGCGFLTKKPSKRARELMKRLTYQI